MEPFKALTRCRGDVPSLCEGHDSQNGNDDDFDKRIILVSLYPWVSMFLKYSISGATGCFFIYPSNPLLSAYVLSCFTCFYMRWPCIILGNLLDNALDATAKVPEREISLDIEYSRHMEITHDGGVFSVTVMLYIAN